MSNTLLDLNKKLFEQLDNLSKNNITSEELEKEIARSESMIKIANVIISNGDLALRAAKFKDDMMNADNKLPKMLEGQIMKKYTDDIIDFLREIAPGKTYKEIVEIFNKKYNLDMTIDKLSSLLSRKKINTGTLGYFKKYHIPWNKGKKGYIGANRTSFKKGNIPFNWKPVGSERVDKDGYTLVKIAEPKKWALKHRIIWEEQHKKKIPKDSVIIFVDGDKSNLNIDNLLCVTRDELKVLNKCRLISSVPELTKVGLNIAKIKIKLAEIRKKKKD